MITVQEAVDIIREQKLYTGTERISFRHSCGRILAEEVKADRDIPPFHRVMMDGIAVRHQDIENGQRSFTVKAVIGAGENPSHGFEEGECAEIMTGAALPEGLDTVIPYEDIDLSEGLAHVRSSPKPGQHVHPRGYDHPANALLLSPGKKLDYSDIGILASVGFATVEVVKLPRVTVISSGNELVEVSYHPLSYQVRKSNVYALEAMLRPFATEIAIEHVTDDPGDITRKLTVALENSDVLVLSGGVSKGKYDYIPESLKNLGVEQLFHRVAQKPGKPFWFGRNEKCFVFALPGNPVSTVLCAAKYLIPWLAQKQQSVQRLQTVPLQKEYFKKTELTYFLPVRLSFSASTVEAIPAEGNGSGDFAHLSGIDGWLELAGSSGVFDPRKELPFIPKVF